MSPTGPGLTGRPISRSRSSVAESEEALTLPRHGLHRPQWNPIASAPNQPGAQCNPVSRAQWWPRSRLHVTLWRTGQGPVAASGKRPPPGPAERTAGGASLTRRRGNHSARDRWVSVIPMCRRLPVGIDGGPPGRRFGRPVYPQPPPSGCRKHRRPAGGPSGTVMDWCAQYRPTASGEFSPRCRTAHRSPW